MVEKLVPLEIPSDILGEIYREARKAYPIECCGWLSGPLDGAGVTKIHRCTNDQSSGGPASIANRTGETAYNITGAELLELNHSLDGEAPARVIYHSHPNGRAYFSDTDKEVAISPWGDGPAYPVQQLVVGIDGQRIAEAVLFDWSYEEGSFVEIARYEGANI